MAEMELPRLSPIRVRESRTVSPFRSPTPPAGTLTQKLFSMLFVVHLKLIAVLVVYLNVRGNVESDDQRHHFHVKEWYPPLAAATAGGSIVAYLWQCFSLNYPSRALKIVFCVCPPLVLLVASLFLLIGTATDLGIGILAVIFAVGQGIYTCLVRPRFEYAAKILSVSTAFPCQTTLLVLISIITIIAYSSFLMFGIGGASASGTRINTLFIFLILVSLEWTTQVIKNILAVAVARIRYLDFTGEILAKRVAIHDAIRYQLGSICIGSILAPIFTVIRGLARGFNLFGSTADEMFCCFANCCSAIASKLIEYGNRWGFVQVGVQNKGFTQASRDTWEMFKRAELIELIDSDLTGSFCFLSGVAGGAICTLIAGIMALVADQSYATELSIYAFLIGYFMIRIAMGSIQACVSAYYVAYAEDPQRQWLDSTIITNRLQQLQRHRQ